MEEIITIFHFIQKKKKHELDLQNSVKCMTCTFFFFLEMHFVELG